MSRELPVSQVARAAPENANEQWKRMVWMWFNEVKWFYFNNP
jgi:hypothetical protein